MQNETVVKGFKAMNLDMTCIGYQYKIGETFKHDGEVVPCVSGFHFCQDIIDINGYYDTRCRIFEVEASGVIFEEGDKTVTDTLTVLKEIDYVDYINNSSDWVRGVVAHKGIGLDVLINDVDWTVRQAVVKQGYGLDKLVNDEHWVVRREVARQGYGLDILINDQAWQVRNQVARQGYGLDVLINDKDWDVRSEVAKQGYGLDVLINDEHWIVRSNASDRLQELENAKPNN